MTPKEPESPDDLRSIIAKAIGYEMICEGKRTGEDISYGVERAVRSWIARHHKT